MLEVNNLSKTFKNPNNNTPLIRDISFSVFDNETVGIVGKSGCGKSTVARMICGTIRMDSGSILFDGESVFQKNGKYKPQMRKKIQLIGQHPYLALDPGQTAGQAIIEPMLRHRLATGKECALRVKELLQKVWLDEEVINKYPHELSGGMCQRVVIAQALSLDPQLIIADESTSMLDTSAQAQVIRLLHRIKREKNISILFISHDLELVKVFSDRILKIENQQLTKL